MSNTIIPVGTKVRINGITHHDGKTGVVAGYYTHLGLSDDPKDFNHTSPYPYEVVVEDEPELGALVFAQSELTVV
jgi:hypothetical protein